ncbi:MAG: phage terminase large subunit [Candidatus Rickettsia vulgarisii]
MLRKKFAYPELKEQIIKLSQKYLPRNILIEDKASGQQIIQDLRLDGFINIVAIKPKLDKITRFASVLPLFQSSNVYIPKHNNILLNKLLNFPHCKNDDIIDSVFYEKLSLPKDINKDSISSSLKNGVLTILLPKAPVKAEEVKKIPIN